MKMVPVSLVVIGFVLIFGGFLQWYAAQAPAYAEPLILAKGEQAIIEFVPRLFTDTECGIEWSSILSGLPADQVPGYRAFIENSDIRLQVLDDHNRSVQDAHFHPTIRRTVDGPVLPVQFDGCSLAMKVKPLRKYRAIATIVQVEKKAPLISVPFFILADENPMSQEGHYFYAQLWLAPGVLVLFAGIWLGVRTEGRRRAKARKPALRYLNWVERSGYPFYVIVRRLLMHCSQHYQAFKAVRGLFHVTPRGSLQVMGVRRKSWPTRWRASLRSTQTTYSPLRTRRKIDAA